MNPATHRPTLFRFLAARAGREVTLDAMIDAVYGLTFPPAAHASIRSMLRRLRDEVGEHGGSIDFVGRGYRYTPGPTAPTFKEEPTPTPWLPRALEMRADGITLRQIAEASGVAVSMVRRKLAGAAGSTHA